MTSSKRHPYIPQFYLKGFTDNNGVYFLFDKQTEEIRKAKPINSFFENNRNTAYAKDQKFVAVEDIYANFDSKAAVQLEKVRAATIENFSLEPEILHRLKAFTALTYWRIPENDLRLEKMIDELSFKDIGLDYKNKHTGESLLTPELIIGLKKIDAFRKMNRLFIPLVSGYDKYKSTNFENWRVYFHKNKVHLTGDNPIVISEYLDFNSLNGELFFPLSSDKLFMHTKKNKPQILPASFLLELDLLILHQATRFVCCPNREYLEFLVEKHYPLYRNIDFANQMKKDIFNYFK